MLEQVLNICSVPLRITRLRIHKHIFKIIVCSRSYMEALQYRYSTVEQICRMLLCGYFWWVYLCKKTCQINPSSNLPYWFTSHIFLPRLNASESFNFQNSILLFQVFKVQKSKLTNRKKKIGSDKKQNDAATTTVASTILDHWIAFQLSILGATIFTERIGHILLTRLIFLLFESWPVAPQIQTLSPKNMLLHLLNLESIQLKHDTPQNRRTDLIASG